MSTTPHNYPPDCECGHDVSHHNRVGPPPFSLRLECLDCECGRYNALVCFFCEHTATKALFVPFVGGVWRCKSGAACQRRIRSKARAS